MVRTPVVVEPPIEQVIRRVQCEYLEMPGLSLTSAQAARLWGLERQACDVVLLTLERTGFLTRTAAGTYVRRAAS